MVKGRSAAGNPLAVSFGTLAAGARIAGGQYLLKRLLGRGSLSEVWLAWDRTREQDVALKFFPATLREDSVFVQKLQEETRRCQQLDHPAVAWVGAFVQDAEHLGVVVERVDGWSLAALQVDRPRKRYALQEILPWLRQLCGALDYAHRELGLVHGDIKPSNLLLNAREQLKVTDFVLADLARRALAQQGHVSQGSLACFSPQQLDANKPSVTDDVYSLGASIYELLTGTPPFYQGDILTQIREATPPLMTGRLVKLGFEGAFPLNWEEAIAACLAKDPSRRPQTISQVLAWLERSEPQAPAESAAKAQPERKAPESSAETAQKRQEKPRPSERKQRIPAEPERSLPPGAAGTPAAETPPAADQQGASRAEPDLERAGAGVDHPSQRSPLVIYAAMFLLGIAVVFGLFLVFRKAPAPTRNERSATQPAAGPAVEGGAAKLH